MQIYSEVYPNNHKSDRGSINLSVTLNVDNTTFTIHITNFNDACLLLDKLNKICDEIDEQIERIDEIQNQFKDNLTLGHQLEKTEQFGGEGFSGEEKY
jgi:hypothetical protein